jgi:hypothetical protein
MGRKEHIESLCGQKGCGMLEMLKKAMMAKKSMDHSASCKTGTGKNLDVEF